MTAKIDKKIVGFSVRAQETQAPPQEAVPDYIQMNESLARPELLLGSTYKIKPGSLDHAMYVTINDLLLNEGTEREHRRPFEIFINSKNMDQFQWVVALTRIMSAVFRKGGDVTFLVEEMKAVFDPKGGYWKPGTGVYVPSVIAEIGLVVEDHLQRIGLLHKEELSAAQKALIEEKRQRATEKTQSSAVADSDEGDGQYPPNAVQCAKCYQKSVVILDGCATCLNCGASKCG